MSTLNNSPLSKTPLHALHASLGGKMVPFAGYDMPVQYPDGIMKEHLWVREKAGLFDVSHMGQAWLRLKPEIAEGLSPTDRHENIARAVESLVPGEILKLKPGGLRYSVLLTDSGGVIDDLMITRPEGDNEAGHLFLVVNAACKEGDFRHIAAKLGDIADLHIEAGRALLALQGPLAATIIDEMFPGAASQKFMTMTRREWKGVDVLVSRCGYTGEDGFEISVPSALAAEMAEGLLGREEVRPIGLGARDSLRLEAGLCLYGHDMTTDTNPVEANISFALGKRRREEGGFPGADQILRDFASGPKTRRVGLRPEGRAPAREGAEIADADGKIIGHVTSGGFAPSLGAPIAMGYVDANHSKTGTPVNLIVRGKSLPAVVVDMPFVQQNYYRG